MQRLPSGEEVDDNSEAWRAHCEANYVANLPTLARRRDFLDMVQKKRGEAAAKRLKDAVRNLWYAAQQDTSASA